MNAAKAAGMTDPAAYRVHVEAEKVKLAAENAVREKNRRAAEAEGAALLRERNRNPASNLLFVAENDMDQCLDALMLGEQLTFRLMDQDGQVAFFLLENDASFGAAYRELAQQIV
jgi:hypothetical protein